MLPRMHQTKGNSNSFVLLFFNRFYDGCNFDKIRSCACYYCNFHCYISFINETNCFNLPLLLRSNFSFLMKEKSSPFSKYNSIAFSIFLICAKFNSVSLTYSISKVSVFVCLITNSFTLPSSSIILLVT